MLLIPKILRPAQGLRRRIAALAVTMLISTTLVSIGTSSPAQATPGECLNGANGFVSTPGTVSDAVTVQNESMGLLSGISIQVRVGTIGGAQRAWARMTGTYVKASDRLWLDWSRNGGATWIQCGPFTAGERTFTPAQRTGAWFRACGRLVPPDNTSVCTAWW